ncbi:MAG: acyl-CoA dehydrogenase [Mariprofundaceae bacterium]|nr:acyl-CoA dehydrogenase [Mariprofundaceae bacterium]
MQWLILIVVVLLLALLLARVKASLMVWSAGIAISLLLLPLSGLIGPGLTIFLWALFLVCMIPLHVDELRLKWLTEPLFKHMKNALPPMSETERAAMQAGNVWWDAELFQGNPDWKKLLNRPAPSLTDEEERFLSGPVEELCSMLDDWDITHKRNDLSPQTWAFIKSNRFFGMIIPKEYGGLGFSAYAHSQVIQKIASRSVAATVTVMVPNSLGPAELLLNYGTEEQKAHFLPRLASGEEVPCFALTGPEAGSDAGAIPDSGIVCKGEYRGRKVPGFRVNWEKRYITLGPAATILGLAFHAYDPDHLLGEKSDLGITCALVPVNAEGVKIGRRHNPLNSAFLNGPNSGRDVFVPFEWVIGGQEQIGNGWRMLVERLAVGRGISLPSMSCGGGKLASLTTGAYARVRKQFHLPIGKFEGVEEAMARIGGLTYMMDSARTLTLSALDQGERPSVVTAIVKYYLTEAMRKVINDAMDVHGGRGICLGPSNYLGGLYQAIPVGITVEGANILTRTLIIFGQGAMRCHPFVMDEIDALGADDEEEGMKQFDALLMQHLAYVTANAARSFVCALSFGRLAPSPVSGPTAAYYRQLSRFSASFAVMADVSLLVLGGALKRKEKLSGRFADALGNMYLCSAVLKRFEDTGHPEAELPLVHWACRYALYQVQEALHGIVRHFPVTPIAFLLRALVFPLGRQLYMPSDHIGHQVAGMMMVPDSAREALVDGIYLPDDPKDIIGRLEHALMLTIQADEIEKRLREAGHRHAPSESHAAWVSGLKSSDMISKDEAAILSQAHRAAHDVIMVDDFPAGRKRSR